MKCFYIVLLLCVVFSSPSEANPTFIIRNGILWGMTKEDVEILEDCQLLSQSDSSISYLDELDEIKLIITYYFAEDCLYETGISFGSGLDTLKFLRLIENNSLEGKNKIIKDGFDPLLKRASNILIRKYGEPKFNYIEDFSFTNLFLKKSVLCEWEINGTMIQFSTTLIDDRLCIIANYFSPGYVKYLYDKF